MANYNATPTKIKTGQHKGEWGARTDRNAQPGDTLTVQPRKGDSWECEVVTVVKRFSDAAIVATTGKPGVGNGNDNPGTPAQIKRWLDNRKQAVWSAYQTAVFALVAAYEKLHAVVSAVAGSGKTTTLVELVARIHEAHAAAGKPAPSILVCAFNVSIKEELQKRIPSHIASVQTTNGVGHAIVCRQGKPTIDDNVLWDAVREQIPSTGKFSKRYQRRMATPDEKVMQTACHELLKLAMGYLADNADALREIAKHHGIYEADERIIDACLRALNSRKTEKPTRISFAEQLWLPCVMGWTGKTYDYVLVDEAQDLNLAKLQICVKSLNANGRLFAVGDPRQAIYGFSGAMSDSIDQIVDWQEANGGSTQLSLPVTYRCAQTIVNEAQEDCPELTAAEGAPEGVIREIEADDFASEITDGDLVLCRVNAPLVSYALKLIRNGIKATIIGRDVSRHLTDLLDKLSKGDHDLLAATFCALIEDYRATELDKMIARQAGDREQERLNDLCDALHALTDGLETCGQVAARIKSIFNADAGIRLSSVHRAKGLEADRVFILHPELMPHPMARQEWEMVQEHNLRYVARTRAKRELVYVIGESRD